MKVKWVETGLGLPHPMANCLGEIYQGPLQVAGTIQEMQVFGHPILISSVGQRVTVGFSGKVRMLITIAEDGNHALRVFREESENNDLPDAEAILYLESFRSYLEKGGNGWWSNLVARIFSPGRSLKASQIQELKNLIPWIENEKKDLERISSL
ncbi:MAG TPA: hypothetical protein VNG90_05470 [Candidatus Acidoferrum sp.]|nr:hypothetical protein [Candidatus Acidoferrum sp.]